MTAAEATPLLGNWAYVALVAAPVVVGVVVRCGDRLGAAVERAAARWDAWCLTPQPRNRNRRRRPPTPRGAR